MKTQNDSSRLLRKKHDPRKYPLLLFWSSTKVLIGHKTPESKQQRILDTLETKHIVSADHTVMRKAGKLSGELQNNSEQIEREDCIIAATALFNDEPVITRNTKHFERVDGLEIRSY